MTADTTYKSRRRLPFVSYAKGVSLHGAGRVSVPSASLISGAVHMLLPVSRTSTLFKYVGLSGRLPTSSEEAPPKINIFQFGIASTEQAAWFHRGVPELLFVASHVLVSVS